MQQISSLTILIFIFLGIVTHFPAALLAEKRGFRPNTSSFLLSSDVETLREKSNLADIRYPEQDSYWSNQVLTLESQWEGVYEKYFKTDFVSLSLTSSQIAQKLSQLSQQTHKKPAIIWMTSTPDYLVLYVITPGQPPIGTRVRAGNQEALSKAIRQFYQQISTPQSFAYLKTAQQLYQLMILPVEYHLRTHKIDTLILCVGPELRSFPFAGLHDGQKYLIEKYAITRIPGFNLTNWNYTPLELEKAQILAMGASVFLNDSPLPGVAAELSAITPQLWTGVTLLNQEFTLTNLKKERQTRPYSIIHLATHAKFNPGDSSNSYIQFSDTRLNLTQMKELNWHQPPVNLLVLSACNTALGDINAELGFVGLAIQSGVNSAIGSLWQVSDLGTLGIMSEFYWQLKTNPLKAEALRQAQIAMIQGQIRWREGHLETPRAKIFVPSALIKSETLDFSHPYYWSGFSLVGNPF